MEIIIIYTVAIVMVMGMFIAFFLILKRGRNNASRIEPKIIPIIEGQFINHETLVDAGFDLIDDAAKFNLKVTEIILIAKTKPYETKN